MIYNIVVVYATKTQNQTASILCNCESPQDAVIAAFRWSLNRWPIWCEVEDILRINNISVREYPIGVPEPNGFIRTGDSLPFFDWRAKKIICPEKIRAAVKPWIKKIQALGQ